ncbi:hypothetical protein [Paenibacillus sp. HGH0039]|uniref:hypothetical protein n=1 Tax=Paenibacillus sp. HGH0039 TaxID=1078505 RepID=UPI001E3958AB|nr:hypothetical protein [Paenibacillus sp. HGH0039]
MRLKILVSQPKLERNLEQLQAEFMMYPDITAAVFPEGYLHTNLSLACELAARTRTLVISGSKNPKDRAVIINREGEIVMDRAKYSGYESVKEEGLLITPILCDELVLREVEEANSPRTDLFVQPIGVGMFSEEQFDEWVAKAKEIASRHHAMVIGTSHADGSFRGSEVSLPIAYWIDRDGEPLFISKCDVRSRVVDLRTKEITVCEPAVKEDVS